MTNLRFSPTRPRLRSSTTKRPQRLPATIIVLVARDHVRYGINCAAGIIDRVAKQHRPLMVNIEPTHRCNLDCTYCDKVDPEISSIWKRARPSHDRRARRAGHALGVFRRRRTARPPGDEEVPWNAKCHGVRVSMSSNGLLLRRKPRVLRFIDVLKISVDETAHVRDAGRGARSFDRAMDGARFAVEAGCKVAIRMTLAEHNVGYYERVIALAKELGVVALFQPAIGNIIWTAPSLPRLTRHRSRPIAPRSTNSNVWKRGVNPSATRCCASSISAIGPSRSPCRSAAADASRSP